MVRGAELDLTEHFERALREYGLEFDDSDYQHGCYLEISTIRNWLWNPTFEISKAIMVEPPYGYSGYAETAWDDSDLAACLHDYI